MHVSPSSPPPPPRAFHTRPPRKGLYFTRYFVLRNGKLYQFADENEYFNCLARQVAYPKGLSLQGYEVMVNTRDEARSFVLSSMDGAMGALSAVDSSRDRHFRAHSEEDHVQWIRAPIAATTIAQ